MFRFCFASVHGTMCATWYMIHVYRNMNSFEIEKKFDTLQKRTVEAARESRETREAETDPELQAAASKERADYLVKEVKTNQQQVQNIALHIVQVQQALKKLRAELQLSEQGDSMSVQQDRARIEILKKQIGEYMSELVAMKEDLIQFEIQELEQQNVPQDVREHLAQQRVDTLLQQLQTT